MAKVRDILVHVSVEEAERKRKCHHNKKHAIAKGESCLVVKGGAFNAGKNYCAECAGDMLKLADTRLKQLVAGL